MPLRRSSPSPARLLVGPGALDHLGAELRTWGDRVLVVGGPRSWDVAGPRVTASLAAANVAWSVYRYAPDCTVEAVAVAAARAVGCQAIVAVGGGKAIDLAKMAATDAGLPCITVPTSAATCAAVTALGNLYDDAGGFSHGRPLAYAPALAVLDTDLMAAAPARLLASGLADALAKWVEASAAQGSAKPGDARAALRLAHELYLAIREEGPTAVQDVRAGRVTPVVTRAIDACIGWAGLVGGLGGERCRSVAAHAICNALTRMPGQAASLHGEKVGFGMVVQLMLEGRPEDARELAAFLAALGLPMGLAALGQPLSHAQLAAVADHVCAPASTAHHLTIPITPATVMAAIQAADQLSIAIQPDPTPSSTLPGAVTRP